MPINQSLGPWLTVHLQKPSGSLENSSSKPTVTSAIAPADCPGPCTVDGPPFSWIVWQSAIPTHIVAATLVYIIDNGTNTTSTSTISVDTTALLDGGHIYPPQPTNAGGTVVTTITFSGKETVLYVIGLCEQNFSVIDSNVGPAHIQPKSKITVLATRCGVNTSQSAPVT